ncbi:MAG: deoxyribodipyrimidine photo-lyase [Hyphomicrobium sp.]|uniref:cryptochrome/photolyase family protein n=1 Tax=Hyphomicrobium sp. TaxID=82 RepID=UPI0039E6839F
MSGGPIIVWFRNDLRLHDHPALTAAVKSGAKIIPLYILDETSRDHWTLGAASKWWLAKSLASLARDIKRRGNELILRRGDPAHELMRLVAETDAVAVHVTRGYEPRSVMLEEKLHASLGKSGVAFKRFGGRLLREPEDVRTSSGGSYQVFTPFWRAFRKDFNLPKALPAPQRIDAIRKAVASDNISLWALSPTSPDWSGGMSATWQPGEDGARQRLDHFIAKDLAGYSERRDRLADLGTSRLSPHLAFGEISPSACWRAAANASGKTGTSDQSIEIFLKELVWREFSHSLLLHFPNMPDEPLRKEFSAFAWNKSSADLKAWQKGLTGYPIVDAGMRELWATGYMHNRARMITASFLTKHLLHPWTTGEAWFWDTLVDADLANNAANWQWVAGCGADAAPYFRIFNPILQGQKFDPDGDYVRCWIPELARLSPPDIHSPWAASAGELKRANVVIGKDYPFPIVDHKTARGRALAAYENLKSFKR